MGLQNGEICLGVSLRQGEGMRLVVHGSCQLMAAKTWEYTAQTGALRNVETDKCVMIKRATKAYRQIVYTGEKQNS